MSKQKYIQQIDNQNFLYPNNTLAEYDVNIIHDLIENQVTGTTGTPVFTSNNGNIDVSVDYTWNLNGAEPFINNNGILNVINVYFQTPDKGYLGNWVNVYVLSTNNNGLTSTGGTLNFTITPYMMGQTSFTITDYYSITFQMISRRTVYPLGWKYYYTPIAVTPTPTATNMTTPTPTPTKSVATPTPTPTPTRTGLTRIGSLQVITSSSCSIIGSSPAAYLDGTDFSIFLNNGGCFSGDNGTVNYIRNSDGSTINGTFYFVFYGGSCSLTTFKSTEGSISLHYPQC